MAFVTKQMFDEFLEKYPNKLDRRPNITVEPPYSALYDGKTSVAFVRMDWMSECGDVDKEGHNKFWQYSVSDEALEDLGMVPPRHVVIHIYEHNGEIFAASNKEWMPADANIIDKKTWKEINHWKWKEKQRRNND